jgi:hypothetical protein
MKRNLYTTYFKLKHNLHQLLRITDTDLDNNKGSLLSYYFPPNTLFYTHISLAKVIMINFQRKCTISFKI